jgi:hypothetical protein
VAFVAETSRRGRRQPVRAHAVAVGAFGADSAVLTGLEPARQNSLRARKRALRSNSCRESVNEAHACGVRSGSSPVSTAATEIARPGCRLPRQSEPVPGHRWRAGSVPAKARPGGLRRIVREAPALSAVAGARVARFVSDSPQLFERSARLAGRVASSAAARDSRQRRGVSAFGADRLVDAPKPARSRLCREVAPRHVRNNNHNVTQAVQP